MQKSRYRIHYLPFATDRERLEGFYQAKERSITCLLLRCPRLPREQETFRQQITRSLSCQLPQPRHLNRYRQLHRRLPLKLGYVLQRENLWRPWTQTVKRLLNLQELKLTNHLLPRR